jgi:hypothetical protein
MSHFTVLVAAKDGKELEQRLAPFQENNMCTCPEEYLEWIDSTDEVLKDYERRLELSEKYDSFNFTEDTSLEEFNEKWGDYTEYEPGKFGYRENPQRKWDWWTVGGRWAGAIFGDAMATPNLIATGRRSGKDSVFVGAVDFDVLRKRQAERAMDEWDNWLEYASPYLDGRAPSSLSDEDVREIAKSINENLSEEKLDAFLWFEPKGLNREQYVQAAYDKALTFAFVDTEGNWFERGNMGWWATVSNEDVNYDARFWAFIEALPDDQRLWVVDCHI